MAAGLLNSGLRDRMLENPAGLDPSFCSKGDRSIFVCGFAKNDLDNFDESDEQDFRALATVLLDLPAGEFKRLVNQGKYVAVQTNDHSKEL